MPVNETSDHNSEPAAIVVPGGQTILTINGGSSSIKFALYSSTRPPGRLLRGEIVRIGQADSRLIAQSSTGADPADIPAVVDEPINVDTHQRAAAELALWLRKYLDHFQGCSVAGVGHRVVHGGPRLLEHQPVTAQLLAELRRTVPLDAAHLPREITLIETLTKEFSSALPVACFDTAFHRDLPMTAQMYPIPRRYFFRGVRRFGFHGLSFSYLLRELGRLAGAEAQGRVILAHLGSGASMAALCGGKPMDTTMGFTPAAGLMMGTRPGDMDPGLVTYLMKCEGLAPEAMERWISGECGLLAVSETSSDMRELLQRRGRDPRAAEAVALFCRQGRKWIGALAAAMGGLDTLVFAGGIGEHAPAIREHICRGLEFMSIAIDPIRNVRGEPIISSPAGRVRVRVISTDEQIMIAEAVLHILKPPARDDINGSQTGIPNQPASIATGERQSA